MPKPLPKKKKNGTIFFLIQHTSAVLYAEFQISTLILVTYRVKYGRYLRMVQKLYYMGLNQRENIGPHFLGDGHIPLD